MKKNSISLFWHLKKKQGRRKWFFLGLLLNCLLLFALSLNSYFRPYYQHNNSFRDKNTFTVKTQLQNAEEGTVQGFVDYYQEDSKETLKNLELKEKCLSTTISYCLKSYQYHCEFIYVQPGFNLLNLGYLPDDVIKEFKKGNTIFLGTPSQPWTSFQNAFLIPDGAYKKDIDVQQYPGTIVFQPIASGSYTMILPISEMGQIQRKQSNISAFYTFLLDKDLNDHEFRRLSSFSGSSQILTLNSSANFTFIHPSREYFRTYILIHNIVSISLYLCSVVLLVSFFAALLSDYLKTGDHLDEINTRRTFGRKESQFILIQESSLTYSLILSCICSLLIYTLFMTIFGAIKGFTFYFGSVYLLLFFGEIAFAIVAEAIFSHLLYQKTSV